MLAVRWPEPFSDPDWVFEIKWDGVRVLLYWDGTRVELRSRRGLEMTARYPEVAAITLSHPAVVDGEIVALDDRGRPSFGLLQQRMNLSSPSQVRQAMRATPVTFVAFDLLYDGGEIIEEPWERRRERLDGLVLPDPVVPSPFVDEDPAELWEFVGDRDLEGLVAKRRAAPYRPGVRSPDWRKIARVRSVRAVVGGFTPGEGGRSGTFGGLQLGLWDGDRLRWIGSVGTGFDDASLRAVRDALDQMVTDRSPFSAEPAPPPGTVFVEPRLVASIRCKEWTHGGKLRAPVFAGFTDDDPADITWESEGPAAPG